ncbi:MAG: hypothetical protein OXM56_04505 [Gammaproteobacteria bacterium]|nr:hypothetical protein [Gammaproteobacteria bacterium]
MTRLGPALVAFAALSAAGVGATPATSAKLDWMLHCQGCHGAEGEVGVPGMPALRGLVGSRLRLPEGRARLVQVPGVANAGLSDARVARLLNWMLTTLDAGHLPEDFEAFTGAEVHALRIWTGARAPGTGLGTPGGSPPGHGEIEEAKPR